MKKVMRGVAAVEATLLLAAGLVVAAQALCKPGYTWWNSDRETCLNCTRCDILQPPLLVLRPCQLHQDTVCGPLKDLDIDWSWLANYRNDYKRKHKRQGLKRKHEQSETLEQNDKKMYRKIVWRFSSPEDSIKEKQSDEIKSQVQVTNTESAHVSEEGTELSDYDDPSAVESYLDYGSDIQVKLESEPFTAESDIVWDLQTILLTLAASVCVVFFIMVAVYSIYHARQWRLIKKNLQADVEGLSAKINLMMASGDCNDQELSTPPPQYTNIRCAYLEQLLVGKNKERGPGPGNVYIQENNT